MINVAGLLLLFCLDRLPSNWLSAIVTLVTILCTGMLAKVSPCPNPTTGNKSTVECQRLK